MNAIRKKAALKVFEPLAVGKTWEEIKEMVLADEKGYTDEEAVEIAETLTANPPKKTESTNVVFEEWKVKPAYKDIKDGMDNIIGRKLTGFEKDAQSPIRKTSISRDRAELLNSQSENTLTRLYEAE